MTARACLWQAVVEIRSAGSVRPAMAAHSVILPIVFMARVFTEPVIHTGRWPGQKAQWSLSQEKTGRITGPRDALASAVTGRLTRQIILLSRGIYTVVTAVPQ